MDIRVKMVTAYLENNLNQELSVDELASSVNLSPSRLRHLFREEAGISLARYIKLVRMQKAKELLESTFLNVKQIMFQVGLKDESHFVRNFKRIYKLSPVKYRASYLGSN